MPMQNPTEPIKNDSLVLADGSSWAIAAGNSYGANLAKILSDTMQLKSGTKPEKHLLAIHYGHPAEKKQHHHNALKLKTSKDNKVSTTTCHLFPTKGNNEIALHLIHLSLIISSQIEKQGGLLIHGALAVKDGQGVILAGPGGIGKTTASHRLPQPWQSLSDDCTLVVQDDKGFYHAHPWPSWSNFMFGGEGGSWDVQHSVPLKAIFMLSQSEQDFIDPLGPGEAVCLLTECSEQASWTLTENFDDNQRQAMNLQRFDNICEIIKTVPTYLLHISKTGTFWNEIERQLLTN